MGYVKQLALEPVKPIKFERTFRLPRAVDASALSAVIHECDAYSFDGESGA